MSMMDQYRDPVIIEWHRDEEGNKISIAQPPEEYLVVNHKILLNQIPDELIGVSIEGMYEISDNSPIEENSFKVDYTQGLIKLHPSQEANTLIVSYSARGIIYYPASRIYTRREDEDMGRTLQSIVDAQVREFIFSTDDPPIDADPYPEGSVWFKYKDE